MNSEYESTAGESCFINMQSVDVLLLWHGHRTVDSCCQCACVQSSCDLKSSGGILVKCQSACCQLTVSSQWQEFKPWLSHSLWFVWRLTSIDIWRQTGVDLLCVWTISWILKLLPYWWYSEIKHLLLQDWDRTRGKEAKGFRFLIKFRSLTSPNFSLLLLLLHILLFRDECCYAAVWGQIDYSVRSPDSQLSPALLWFAEMSFWLMPAVIISSMAQ